MRREDRFAVVIAFLVLVVYAAFRTRNYYWDGIFSALTIEQIPELSGRLFNPNHLLGNWLGWIFYQPLHQIWPAVRAHFVLTVISTLASVGSTYILFRLLQRYLRNEYYSACLTLLFAFSATWWKFSTDANVYVPSIFFLMLAVDRLTDPQRKIQPITIGLLHAMSMLLHQIAIFFYPAAVVALAMNPATLSRRERAGNMVLYTGTAVLTVVGAYAWAWFAFVDRIYSRSFWNWVTANGREEWSFVSMGMNSWQMLRGTVRVFFEDRLSIALNLFGETMLMLLVVTLGIAIMVLLIAVIRTVNEWFKDDEFVEAVPREVRAFLLAWVGPFFLFLFFWLTQFPYYRLFYLPAFVLASGLLLKGWGLFGPMRRTHAMLIFLLVMALSNFIFLIYPYTSAEASPPVRLALEANHVWRDNVIVYYRELNGDNATLKYFNPQTHWRPIDVRNPEAMEEEVAAMLLLGKSVWLDTTALDYLKGSPEIEHWITRRVKFERTWGFANDKHRIQFVKLAPKRRFTSS